ncbi:calcium-binding protein [Neogemmobacter tilapiae]|nr:M10 family metallopeptidase C-terminal domain-containing protein [Gemmobacter tilapiae]
MKLAEVTLSGTTGNDTLTGSYGADAIAVLALAGDDLIYIVGTDVLDIDGGDGNDTIGAMLGDNIGSLAEILGGAGDDLLAVSGARQEIRLNGGTGNDSFVLDAQGASGDQSSILTIDGGDGDDIAIGQIQTGAEGALNTTLDMGAGDDLIDLRIGLSQTHNLLTLTGAGDDVVRLAFEVSATAVEANADLRLGEGDDFAAIGKGNASAGTITVLGQAGDDVLRGTGGGPLTLSGGAGHDRLVSALGQGTESIVSLKGGVGQDVLVAGHAVDMMEGGTGADVFVFAKAFQGAVDSITDFRHGVDQIDLSGFMDGADFIGSAKFSGDGAELRIVAGKAGSPISLIADVNGDGKADWKIYVQTNMLTAGDLIL